MSKFRFFLLSVFTTAILAGCGGGSDNKTLSYSDFSSQANQICQDAEDQNKALGKTTTAAATPENGALVDKLVAIVQKQKDKLAGLKAPDQLKSSQDEFVSLADQQITIAKKASTAAKAKDQAGYVSAIKELQALSPKSNAAGSKLGAAACAK
jgi:hypothetical protein